MPCDRIANTNASASPPHGVVASPKPLPASSLLRVPNPPAGHLVVPTTMPQAEARLRDAAMTDSSATATADTSLSLSPSPMSCRTTGTSSTTDSGTSPASLFYSDHVATSFGSVRSTTHLSQSLLSTAEVDRRARRSLPACPPRHTTTHGVRSSFSAETHTAVPTPSRSLLADSYRLEESENVTSVFSVNGCPIRQLPQYAIMPTASRTTSACATAQKRDSFSSCPSHSRSAELSTTARLPAAAAAVSASQSDKLAAEWTSWDSADDGFGLGTESEFWESTPHVEEHLLLHAGVLPYLLTREGAKRSALHRADTQ